MIIVFGLKNCDTCRKSLKWLAGQSIDHRFHDVRGDGVPAERIGIWLDAVGRDILVNRRSTTWRNLSEAQRAQAMGDQAAAFLADNPTLIKRPVIDIDGQILVGFNTAVESTLLKSRTTS